MVTERDDDSLTSRLRRTLLIGASSPKRVGEMPIRAVAIPLTVRDHVVGVLRIATEEGLTLTIRAGAAAHGARVLRGARRRASTSGRDGRTRRGRATPRSTAQRACSRPCRTICRTPLTTIKGIAQRDCRRRRSRREPRIIEDEADRLDTLVGDLLDLSRIHAGAVHPALGREHDRRSRWGRRSRPRRARSLRGRPVDVDLPRDDAARPVYFDLTQTLRILVNLIDNAREVLAGREPDRDSGARGTQTACAFTVMDRGPGVPGGTRADLRAILSTAWRSA